MGATGRSRAQWYALLDDAGAAGWDHKQMAAWLVETHDVDGWWAQGLTVGYEQARGLRLPGQRPDGTFEASVSRTLAHDVDGVFPHLADATRRAHWLPGTWQETGVTPGKSVRLAADDGTRLLLTISAAGPGKVRVTVTSARLAGADDRDRAKTLGRAALATLAQSLGQ